MPQLDVGASIGDYEIEAVLGRGGMGTVYRARQKSPERLVALKVLADEFAEDIGFRERFVRESRLVAATEHKNIIPVYDAGEQDGVLYLTMLYVEGPTLQNLVGQQGALDPKRAAGIVSDVGAALDAAHARDLVHRDVKPSNVMIDRQGGRERVYLTDFGLAKRTASRTLTQAGVLVGTLDYLPPEAIMGETLDARADVYALGAILFFALTARVPYEKDSPAAVLYAHVTEPAPSPSVVNPSISAAFDDVVTRAMAKQPSDRYRTAGELGAAAVQAAAMPHAPAVGRGDAAASKLVAPPPLPSPEPAPPPIVHLPTFARDEADKTFVWGRTPEISPQTVAPPPGSETALVRFRLHDDFRYVHEPLARDHGIPFLGTRQVVDALKERIEHSTGGSFLITGFRGVGKTTVIRRALEELTAENGDGPHIVPISLNVARPMSTDELLFEVVRRLFEALIDGGILERLSPEIQRALVLAYTRTSLSFKETRANSHERGRSLDLGLGALAGPLGRVTPKLSFSKKETRSLATEAAFLAYSDADVEHDFLRIVSLVHRAEAPPALARRWAWARRSHEAPDPWLGHLVVVIDELDKLTERDDGPAQVELILTGLKNLLTTRGVHFLFVAGPDLHDRALSESHQGNSVYESVFGWHVYVPCMWEAPGQLLDRLVHPDDQQDEWYALLRDYLTFKARGIPRLLLIELNSYVTWQDDHPVLKLDQAGIVRVKFYAALQRILTDFLRRADNGSGPFAIPIDEDRWRLGAYYVTDWIIRRREAEFTIDEIVGSLREERSEQARDAKRKRTATAPHAVDRTLVISSRKVEQLIEHLVEHGIVEQVRGRPDQAYQSDAPAAQKAAYAVVKEKYEELARVERGSERERAELGADAGYGLGGQPWDESGTLGFVAGGRYELLRELDRGGLASVYHARDRVLGRDVAVKMLEEPSLLANPAARARFERQGAIASTLVHPNIVPTYDTFVLEDRRLGIVMQLVEGVSLRSVLDWAPLPGPEAARLGAEILDALEYVSDQGIVRLDLKPANVILDSERKPIIVDLGLAKVVDGPPEQRQDITIVGALVGTPAYFSPEQASGAPVDIRTDIYTVGLLLYEMLTGRLARPGEQVGLVIEQARHADVDVSRLAVSPELRAVVARALARNPEERFASPAEMRAALLATPEATGAGAGTNGVSRAEEEE